MEPLKFDIHREIEKVLNKANKLKVDYADVRVQDLKTFNISRENGKLERISSGNDLGIGIKVILNGKVGFYSSNKFDPELALKNALKLAKLNPKKEKVKLKETKAIKDEVKSKSSLKNQTIENKIKLLQDFEKYAKISPKIKSLRTIYFDVLGKNYFFNNEGAAISSDINRTSTLVVIVAKEGTDLERTNFRIGGLDYEIYKDHKILKSKIQKKAKLAVDLLKAKKPKGGIFKVILDPDSAGTFAHEAVGHASEADHILVNDSILKGRLGQKIASSVVNLSDDGTRYGWGYYKYDDEGVPPKKTEIIKKGILNSFLHSRETAEKLNADLTGNARAESYASLPIVRMSNTYFENGKYSFEEMLEKIKDGYYLVDWKSGQVGTLEGTFTFNSASTYKIENGQITDLLNGCNFSGKTLETLKEIIAIQKNKSKYSVGYCGKYGQMVPVTSGKCHVAINKLLIGGM